MRRIVLVAPVAVVSAGLAFAAPGTVLSAPAASHASSARLVQGDCHLQTVVVLFWPNGHGAIRSLRSPKMLRPHVEVYAYRGVTTYLPANRVAYTGTDRKLTLVKGCKRVATKRSFRALRARSVRTKVAVTCAFNAGTGHVQLAKVARKGVRAELRLIDPPNKLVLRAQLARNGSNMSYSVDQCRQGKAPG